MMRYISMNEVHAKTRMSRISREERNSLRVALSRVEGNVAEHLGEVRGGIDGESGGALGVAECAADRKHVIEAACDKEAGVPVAGRAISEQVELGGHVNVREQRALRVPVGVHTAVARQRPDSVHELAERDKWLREAERPERRQKGEREWLLRGSALLW